MTTQTSRYKTTIDNTKYDLYNWSYKEGKKIEGNVWSVSIPDGFNRISSKEGRPFELESYSNNTLFCSILPGSMAALAISLERWPDHLVAKKYLPILAATARLKDQNTANKSKIPGIYPIDVMMFCTDKTCGYIHITKFPNENGKILYIFDVYIYGEETRYDFTVLMYNRVSPQQAEQLKQSVLSWAKTYQFNKGNTRSFKPFDIVDASMINRDLKKGELKQFNEFINNANRDISFALSGSAMLLEYQYKNHLIDYSQIKPVIQEAYTVLEDYLNHAFMILPSAENVSPALMVEVYSKVIDELCAKNDYIQKLPFSKEFREYYPNEAKNMISLIRSDLQNYKSKVNKSNPYTGSIKSSGASPQPQQSSDRRNNRLKQLEEELNKAKKDKEKKQQELSKMGIFSYMFSADSLSKEIKALENKINDISKEIEILKQYY